MNPLDALKRADEALKKQVAEKQRLKNEQDRQTILEGVSRELPNLLEPLLNQVAENSRVASDEIINAIKGVKIEQPKVDVKVDVPKAEVQVKSDPVVVPKIDTSGIEEAISKGLKNIKVPKPEVTVNTPEIKFPEFPEPVPFDGNVTLKDVGKKNPLPVMMMGLDGHPMQFSQGAGGGRGDFFTIKDIQTSSGSSIIDNDGFVKVTGNFSVTAAGASSVSLINSDGTYYNSDNPLPVTGTFSSSPAPQVSGASDSVNVMMYGGVSVPTGKNETTDGVFRIIQMTDSVSSVYVTGASGTIGTVIINPDGNPTYASATSGLTDTELRASSVPVAQASGAIWSVYAQDALTTVSSTSLVNADNRIRVSVETGGSGLTDSELRASSVPVSQVSGNIDSVNVVTTVGLTDTQLRASTLDIKQVSGSTDSVNLLTINGNTPATGLNETTSGVLRVVQMTDSNSSVNITNTSLAVTKSGTWAIDNPVAQGDAATALRVVIAGNSDASVTATQTGTWNINAVTSITNSLAASLVDSSGVQYSGSNPVPVNNSQWGGNSVPSGLNETTGGVVRTVLMTDSVASVVVNSGTITSVTSITNSLAANIVDSSGVAYTTTNPLPVGDAGGSLTVDGTVTVSDVTNSLKAALIDSSGVQYSGSNPVPVTGTVAVSSVTNSLAVVALDRDGNPLTTGPIDNGDAATALRVVVAGNSAASVSATQVGTWNTTIQDAQATSFSAFTIGDYKSFPTVILDGSGNQITSFGGGTQYSIDNNAGAIGIGTVALGVRTSTAASVVSADLDWAPHQMDANGNMWATLGTKLDPVNDSITTYAAGSVVQSTQTQLIARTTNPTAATDGTAAFATSDKLGRQLTRPVQARELLTTAYVALSTGSETTLISGVAGSYLDLVMITASNNSTAATQLDIRAVTGGNIIHTMYLPASTGPVGFSPSVPWPQDATGNNWTIDMPDQTGTTVYVSALFSKES